MTGNLVLNSLNLIRGIENKVFKIGPSKIGESELQTF